MSLHYGYMCLSFNVIKYYIEIKRLMKLIKNDYRDITIILILS